MPTTLTPKQTHTINNVILEWVDEWVIGLNFCPFAKPVRHKNSIHISIVERATIETVLVALDQECEALLRNPSRATTLIALIDGAQDFYQYLDMVDTATAHLNRKRLGGIFQLASFHPHYLFAGEPSDSSTHFTNRSPLPLLHLLREDDISQAIPSQREADAIVAKNQLVCQQQASDFFERRLKDWQSRLHQPA